MQELLLEVSDISKSYGNHVVFKNLSFKLHYGQVFVICGVSGSGKSTLIRCINGLEDIDSGTIKLNGVLITKKNIREIRKKVTMVFQAFNLFPHLTALENAMISPVKILKRPKGEVLKEVKDLFEMVGLSDRMNAQPRQLSGGEQQRAAIVRAVAMKPDLMLFDEPTSALDPEMIKGVLDVVRKLAKKGMSMVIVTHEMGFAREVADYIAFLGNKNFIEVKPPEDFFEHTEHELTKRFLAEILHAK